MDWDSAQYLKYKAERTQPAIDLVNRINMVNPKKILDIGCGPGNSTEVLYNKYPNAYILGVDKSEEMTKTASTNSILLKLEYFQMKTRYLDRDMYDILKFAKKPSEKSAM